MTSGTINDIVQAAIAAIEMESITVAEKIDMLIVRAKVLQKSPQNCILNKQSQQSQQTQHVHSAIELYLYAIELCGDEYLFLRARAMVGLANALRNIPDDGADLLIESRQLYEAALGILREHADATEIAETEMYLGLVLQSLVPFGKARITESIQTYQRALRVFTGHAYPQEYAVLQNNLAIAYLGMAGGSDPQTFQQEVAVQVLEQALHWITPLNHPREYAMLQNNLGHALQSSEGNCSIENSYRAVLACNEALKVRNPKDTPLEYADTLANKAKALANLPDNQRCPEQGNLSNLRQALSYYREAIEIFRQHNQSNHVQLMLRAIEGLEAKLI